MFDWSGKNQDKSGKGQGILISYVSGNLVKHMIGSLSSYHTALYVLLASFW